MAAEVIFFKHASDPTSPLVSDALALKSKALTTVSRLRIIWPLASPETSSQAPL